MELQLHTKAEGTYYFYSPDESGDLTLIGQSDNAITQEGLEYVKTYEWVKLFTTLRVGSADHVPVPDHYYMKGLSGEYTAVGSLELYANPGCGSYVFGDTDNSLTYVHRRSWRVNNSTSTDWVIKEVGAAPLTPADNKDLFSYSVLPPAAQVTLSAGKFIIAMYELRLTTTSVASGKDIKFFTGGVDSYQIPATNYHGVLASPFALLQNAGTEIYYANTAADGNLLFEPSNTSIYGGFIVPPTSPTTSTTFVNQFLNARNEFKKLSAAGPLQAVNPAPPTYVVNSLGNSPHLFHAEPTDKYIFKRSFRLTTGPITGARYNGLVITTKAPTSLADPEISGTGWQLVFSDTWLRPNNTYLELSVTHTWS
jgi:hypothetical protein